MSNGVERLSAFDDGGTVPAAIGAEEDVALRVVAGNFFRAREEREVIAALAVFGLVVDHAVFDFDLAGVEVALEVGGIVLRIPQAELDAGENRKLGGLWAAIRHRQLPDFEILIERHEVAGARFNAGVLRPDGGVAHAVTARILLQFVLRGLPGGGPEFARGIAASIIAKINVASAQIEGSVVVAVARDAAQARVAVKRIATGSIGDDAEVGLAAEVVDPRQRRIGLSDYVLAVLIVEVPVFHEGGFPKRRFFGLARTSSITIFYWRGATLRCRHKTTLARKSGVRMPASVLSVTPSSEGSHCRNWCARESLR